MAKPAKKPETKKPKPRRAPEPHTVPENSVFAPVGRPSNYRPEYARQAVKLCELGATDIELAQFFETNTETLRQWKLKHPEFTAALRLGKDHSNDRVERSLYAKACGYTYESEKVFCSDGEVTRVAVTEHVPPDTTACIFWLKNRMPDVWRDRREAEDGDGKDVLIRGGLPQGTQPSCTPIERRNVN